MRRRAFIALFGAAVAEWPFVAHAQRPAMPVIGFLNATEYDYRVRAFQDGLAELGYVEGRGVSVEYRWAEGHYDRLAALAADLVNLKVAVIVATGGPQVAMAAQKATTTIPIVFTTATDPVKDGLVASLSRPGKNLTGVTFLAVTLLQKQVQIVREIVPEIAVIGLLMNPASFNAELQVNEVRTAAEALGLRLFVANATSEDEFEAAFAAFRQGRAAALVVCPDAYFNNRRRTLVALAERYAIPAIYSYREYVAAGGLMSYGASIADGYRLAGLYAGRILKGEQPAQLPIQQSTKVELTINLKVAKALGLTIPLSLLGRADEVVE